MVAQAGRHEERCDGGGRLPTRGRRKRREATATAEEDTGRYSSITSVTGGLTCGGWAAVESSAALFYACFRWLSSNRATRFLD